MEVSSKKHGGGFEGGTGPGAGAGTVNKRNMANASEVSPEANLKNGTSGGASGSGEDSNASTNSSDTIISNSTKSPMVETNSNSNQYRTENNNSSTTNFSNYNSNQVNANRTNQPPDDYPGPRPSGGPPHPQSSPAGAPQPHPHSHLHPDHGPNHGPYGQHHPHPAYHQGPGPGGPNPENNSNATNFTNYNSNQVHANRTNQSPGDYPGPRPSGGPGPGPGPGPHPQSSPAGAPHPHLHPEHSAAHSPYGHHHPHPHPAYHTPNHGPYHGQHHSHPHPGYHQGPNPSAPSGAPYGNDSGGDSSASSKYGPGPGQPGPEMRPPPPSAYVHMGQSPHVQGPPRGPGPMSGPRGSNPGNSYVNAGGVPTGPPPAGYQMNPRGGYPPQPAPGSQVSGQTPTLNQLLQAPNPSQRYQTQNSAYGDPANYPPGKGPNDHSQQNSWNAMRPGPGGYPTGPGPGQLQPMYRNQGPRMSTIRGKTDSGAAPPPPLPPPPAPVGTGLGAAQAAQAAAQAAVMAAANSASLRSPHPHSSPMYLRQHLQQKMYGPGAGPVGGQYPPPGPPGMPPLHGTMGPPPMHYGPGPGPPVPGHPPHGSMMAPPPHHSDSSMPPPPGPPPSGPEPGAPNSMGYPHPPPGSNQGAGASESSSNNAAGGASTVVTQSITSPLSAPATTTSDTRTTTSGPQPPPIVDEASQASTTSSQPEDGGDNLKANSKGPPTFSHPPTPNTLGSPGAASMSSFHDEFESVSSPSWPRTPASPVVNSQGYESHGHTAKSNKRPDGLLKLYEMSDEPERRAFLDKLIGFNEERGSPLNSCPTISKHPLDLYRLYSSVKERGGFIDVTRQKLWKECAQICNIAMSSSAAYTLRKQYIKHLLPFECKFDRGGVDAQLLITQTENQNRKKGKGAPSPGPGDSNSQGSYPQSGTPGAMDGPYGAPPTHPSPSGTPYPQGPGPQGYPSNSDPGYQGPVPGHHQGAYPHPAGHPPSSWGGPPPAPTLPVAGAPPGQHPPLHSQPTPTLPNHSAGGPGESISAQDPFSDEMQPISGYNQQRHPSGPQPPASPSSHPHPQQGPATRPTSGPSSHPPAPHPHPHPPQPTASGPNSSHEHFGNTPDAAPAPGEYANRAAPVAGPGPVPAPGAPHPPPPSSHHSQQQQQEPYGATPPSTTGANGYPPSRTVGPQGYYNQTGYEYNRDGRAFDHHNRPDGVYSQQPVPPTSQPQRIPYQPQPTQQGSQHASNAIPVTGYPVRGPPMGPGYGAHGAMGGQQVPYTASSEVYRGNDITSNYQNAMLRTQSPLAARLLAAKMSQPTHSQSQSQSGYPGSTATGMYATPPGAPPPNKVAPPSVPSPAPSPAGREAPGMPYPSAYSAIPKRHPDFMKEQQPYPINSYGAPQGPPGAQYPVPPFSGPSNRQTPPGAGPPSANQAIWNRESQYRGYGPPSGGPPNSTTAPQYPPNSLTPRDGWDPLTSRSEAGWGMNRFGPGQAGPNANSHGYSGQGYTGYTSNSFEGAPGGGSHQIKTMTSYPPRGNDPNRMFSPSPMPSGSLPPNKSAPPSLPHLQGPNSVSSASPSPTSFAPGSGPTGSHLSHHHAFQQPVKKEVIFPPDSVEGTQPILLKKRRLTSKDMSQVEAWRLLMCLKSGMLAESSWALDVLSVLLHDDNTVLYFGLQNLPGLLEVLLEHYKKYLSEIFDGLFDDTEVGYGPRDKKTKRIELSMSAASCKDSQPCPLKSEKKWYEIEKDLKENSEPNGFACDSDDEEVPPNPCNKRTSNSINSDLNLNIPKLNESIVLLNSSLNFTFRSRDGKPVKVKKAKKVFLLDPERKWDSSDEGFSSGSDHWAQGMGETTSHIQTHFEPKEKFVRFAKVLQEKRINHIDNVNGAKSSSHSDSKESLMDERPNASTTKSKNSVHINCKKEPVTPPPPPPPPSAPMSSDNDVPSVTKLTDTLDTHNKSPNNSNTSISRKDLAESMDTSEKLSASSHSKSPTLCNSSGDKEKTLLAMDEKSEDEVEVDYPRFRTRKRKFHRFDDLEDEAYNRDDPPLCAIDDYCDAMARRCLCLSTLIRNLSFVPGNDVDMSKHRGLLMVMSRLLLLNHSHPEKKRNFEKTTTSEEDLINIIEDKLIDRVDDNNSSAEAGVVGSGVQDKEWWWDTLHFIRENTLVTVANISGQLDLSPFPEEISLPLLDGLLHWAVCPSSYAQDHLPTTSLSALSPQRLSMEALVKLSILESNVDLILATPPWERLDRLFRQLAKLLSRNEEQALREFSLVLLVNLAAADTSIARAIAMTGNAIPQLISFVEQSEQSALSVANSQGINALRENPELMGTTLDMVRRSAACLRYLARIPDNRPLFLNYQQRLLALVMSQILDQGVASIIADVIYEFSLTDTSVYMKSLLASEKACRANVSINGINRINCNSSSNRGDHALSSNNNSSGSSEHKEEPKEGINSDNSDNNIKLKKRDQNLDLEKQADVSMESLNSKEEEENGKVSEENAVKSLHVESKHCETMKESTTTTNL